MAEYQARALAAGTAAVPPGTAAPSVATVATAAPVSLPAATSSIIRIR